MGVDGIESSTRMTLWDASKDGRSSVSEIDWGHYYPAVVGYLGGRSRHREYQCGLVSRGERVFYSQGRVQWMFQVSWAPETWGPVLAG